MKNMTLLILGVFGAGLAADADEIIARTSKNYEAIKSFSAQFDRKTCNVSEEVCQLSQGKISYQEPDLFRIEISSPNKETYVSDGADLWIYVPAQKKVVKQPIADHKMILSPRYFLDDFKERFTCTLEEEGEKTWKVKLVPKDETYFLQDIILTIDRATYRVLGFATFDKNETNIGFDFVRLVTNPRLNAKLFTFKVPKGVEVIGP